MPGEIWWVYNEALGIEDPGTKEHPVLVVGGSNVSGGPVGVAKGSTKTGHYRPGEPVINVRPEDVEKMQGANGRLEGTTTFRIVQGEVRVNREKMKDLVGRISPEQLEQVRELRRQHRRQK